MIFVLASQRTCAQRKSPKSILPPSCFTCSPHSYVCKGGSSSPKPTDGHRGYLCPPGHSCPAGCAEEMPCEAGSYSPSAGRDRCILCLDGTVCPSVATRAPSVCPPGQRPGARDLNQTNSTIKHALCHFIALYCNFLVPKTKHGLEIISRIKRTHP